MTNKKLIDEIWFVDYPSMNHRLLQYPIVSDRESLMRYAQCIS